MSVSSSFSSSSCSNPSGAAAVAVDFVAKRAPLPLSLLSHCCLLSDFSLCLKCFPVPRTRESLFFMYEKILLCPNSYKTGPLEIFLTQLTPTQLYELTDWPQSTRRATQLMQILLRKLFLAPLVEINKYTYKYI